VLSLIKVFLGCYLMRKKVSIKIEVCSELVRLEMSGSAGARLVPLWRVKHSPLAPFPACSNQEGSNIRCLPSYKLFWHFSNSTKKASPFVGRGLLLRRCGTARLHSHSAHAAHATWHCRTRFVFFRKLRNHCFGSQHQASN